MKKDHMTGKKPAKMAHLRWRKARGIKMVMSIVPIPKSDKKRAVCLFEGKQFVGVGKTHTEALKVCMEIVMRTANLEE